jgi:hypothetical protein
MTRYRIKYHTGPDSETIDYYARRVLDAIGPCAIVRGTEHLYFTIEAIDWIDATQVARRALGDLTARLHLQECAL